MTAPNPTALRPNLQLPIAIPSTDAALGSPFLRAYPLELEAFDLSAPTFLEFLDGLNRVVVVSPPVQVLGLVGKIVGMVHFRRLKYGAVEVAAGLTAYGMSKGRSEMFLSQANEELFAPRGLRIDIVRLEALALVAEIPILDASGTIAKGTSFLAPIDDPETSDLSAQQRRLLALAPWTGPLELIPSDHVTVPKNMLERMHAIASERQRAKEESSILKRRVKAHDKGQKRAQKTRDDFDKNMDKLAKDEAKINRKEMKDPDKMQRALQQLEKKRSEVQREYEEEVEKDQRKKAKKDKEEAAMRKILGLLIRNKDDPDPRLTTATSGVRIAIL